MISKLTIPCVCLSLALGVGVPASAHASPAETKAATARPEAPIPVGLYVDASAVAEQEFHSQLEQVVMQRLTASLEQAGYEVSDGKVVTVVRVRFISTEAARFRDHGIYFEFVQGERVDPAIQWVLCENCVQVRLEEKLAAATPELLESLGHRVEALASEAADEPGDGAGDGDGEQPQPPPTKAIGGLGYTGIGVAALGIGAAIVGAVELSRGKVYGPRGFNEVTTIDHTPPGYALVGIGASVAVAGLVMLGVDMGRRAKQRKQARVHQTQITPSISPYGASIGLSGKF